MLVIPGGQERTEAEYADAARQGRFPSDSRRADGVGRERRGSGIGVMNVFGVEG